MWPTQIVALVITVCVYGCLCLTRTKRAVLNGDDNPYDLRAALRVLERERRRLELQAIEPVPKREVNFEQQPVIVDNQDDDPDFLAQAVAEKGDSVFYGPDQAKDVENLLREVEEQKRAENEATEEDLETVYGHPLSDMDIDMDKYQELFDKRPILKKKAFPGKRATTKGLDLTAGKRSAEALKSAFNSLTPDEIHKLLMLEGRLQSKDINKRQRKTKPMVVDIRSQPVVDLEDAVEAEDAAAAIPISKEELEGLIQAQGGATEESEGPSDADNLEQVNDIIQAESAAVDPTSLEDQPMMDSEIFNSALQDLAALEMLQKAEENVGPEEDPETVARWEQAEMSKLVPMLLGAAPVPVLSQSRQEPVRDNDERQKRRDPPTEIDASTKLSTTPSLAEMVAKLWIKHKLEGMEIDYLADALNAATLTQSSESAGAGNLPIEINSLQKAVRIEKMMKELDSNDDDIERDGLLDQLALKYLQRHQLEPEDTGITLAKKNVYDDKIQAAAEEARKKEEEEDAEADAAVATATRIRAVEEEERREAEAEAEEDYTNNLLRGDDNGQMPLLYEIPDNTLNPIPSLPRQEYQNRIPYQLMDIPDNSEDEDIKDNDEIPLSQDIGLINTEGDDDDNSAEPAETEREEVLSPEESRRFEAEASLRNMLGALDTDDNLRKQDTSEEENEETLYYQKEREKCPVLEMSRDCQFADMLNIPLNGRKRDLCNRHEMCYNCGTTIGLGASICDRGFLSDSIKECNGNLNCIRLADIFLRLMRVTHKFNNMPNNVCNVACVRDYVIGL